MATDSTVSPLRQRMIEDMAARKLGRHSQRSHIHSRLSRALASPDTATPDDVRGSGLAPDRERIEHLQSQHSRVHGGCSSCSIRAST